MAEVIPQNETEMQATRSIPRSPGIDACRLVMAFLVVTLHSLPVRGSAEFSIIGMVCRCAVPFFFITSGYFLKIPARFSAMCVVRPLVRLFPIYLFWMIAFYSVAYISEVHKLQFGVRELLVGGTAFHLWYLPALGVAMVLVPISILKLGARVTGLICALLATVVITRGAYHGVFHMPGSPTRGGFFVAPIYLFIGYWLAKRRFEPSLSFAALIALLGFAILLGEELWISRWLGTRLKDHDFTIGTFAFGAGVFLFAKELPAGAALERLAALGKYALGIYVSHLLFIWGLVAAFGSITLAGMLWRVPVAFVGALMLTAGLQRTPYLKRMVA